MRKWFFLGITLAAALLLGRPVPAYAGIPCECGRGGSLPVETFQTHWVWMGYSQAEGETPDGGGEQSVFSRFLSRRYQCNWCGRVSYRYLTETRTGASPENGGTPENSGLLEVGGSSRISSGDFPQGISCEHPEDVACLEAAYETRVFTGESRDCQHGRYGADMYTRGLVIYQDQCRTCGRNTCRYQWSDGWSCRGISF